MFIESIVYKFSQEGNTDGTTNTPGYEYFDNQVRNGVPSKL